MLILTQQTRDIEPMLVQCWASVVDDGPALNQHWVNVSCLLGDTSPGDEILICTWVTFIQYFPCNRVV